MRTLIGYRKVKFLLFRKETLKYTYRSAGVDRRGRSNGGTLGRSLLRDIAVHTIDTSQIRESRRLRDLGSLGSEKGGGRPKVRVEHTERQDFTVDLHGGGVGFGD